MTTVQPGDYAIKVRPLAADPRYKRVRNLFIAAGITLGLIVGFVAGFIGRADAAGCIGNNAVRVAPYTCTVTKIIDGTAFTATIDAPGDGTISAAYRLDAPRPIDTPIRVSSNRGISSTDTESLVAGIIPAGQTTAFLKVRNLCGQFDVKAVHTGRGDARGRVGGPYVTEKNDCKPTHPTTTTTAPTTTAATTTVATTLPETTTTAATTTAPSTTAGETTTTTGATSSTGPTTVPLVVATTGTTPTTAGETVAPAVRRTLPASGPWEALGIFAAVALGVFVVGSGIVAVTRRRAP